MLDRYPCDRHLSGSRDGQYSVDAVPIDDDGFSQVFSAQDQIVADIQVAGFILVFPRSQAGKGIDAWILEHDLVQPGCLVSRLDRLAQ